MPSETGLSSYVPRRINGVLSIVIDPLVLHRILLNCISYSLFGHGIVEKREVA